MSHYEPFKTDPNDTNPLYAGSSAWANPALREIYEPPHEQNAPTPEPYDADQQLPMWAYLLLVTPVLGAIVSTDPETPALIRWGWFPALILAAIFIAWRLLRRAD